MSQNESKSPANENKSFLDIENCYLIWYVHVSPLNYGFYQSVFLFSCFSYSNRSDNFLFSLSRFRPSANQAQLVNFACQIVFERLWNFGRQLWGLAWLRLRDLLNSKRRSWSNNIFMRKSVVNQAKICAQKIKSFN